MKKKLIAFMFLSLFANCFAEEFFVDGLEIKDTESKSAKLSIDGWNFNLTELHFSGNKLSCKATTSLDENQPEYTFNNFSITKKDGENIEITGKGFYAEDKYLIKNDYMITISGNAEFYKKENHYVICSELLLKSSHETKALSLGKSYIDSKGNITQPSDSDKNPNKVVFYNSADSYKLKIETLRFDEERDVVLFSGSIAPKSWESYLPVSEGIINPDFSVSINNNTYNKSASYKYNGWTIYPGALSELNSDYFVLKTNDVIFNEETLSIGDLEFTSEGSLIEEVITYFDEAKEVKTCFITESKIYQLRFSDEGLYASIDTALPTEFNGFTVEFGSVILYPDGNFNAEYIIPQLIIPGKYVSFDFEDISFSNDGFFIDEVEMIFSKPEEFTIQFSGLSISKNGINIFGSGLSPFKIGDLLFCINNLSFKENKFESKGFIVLPVKMPGYLSNRTITINNFSIMNINDTKKSPELSLEASLEGESFIPFLEDSRWSFEFSGLTVRYGLTKENTNDNKFYIEFENAELIAPSGYGVNSVPVEEIRLSVSNSKPEFIYKDVSLNLDNIDLVIPPENEKFCN